MKDYNLYKVGDTVYAMVDKNGTYNPIIMECVVEELLGEGDYRIYDITQNIMHVRHVSELVSVEDMKYSVSEWLKIKFNKDGNK